MTTLPRPLPAGNAGPRMVRALIGPATDDPDPKADTIELAPPGFEVAVSMDLLAIPNVAVTAAPPPTPEPPAVPPFLAERIAGANRLERNWWQLRANLEEVTPLVAAHAHGWVAAADKLASDDDAWPAEARFPLRAAGFVLDSLSAILRGEVWSAWGAAPGSFVHPMVPLLDPDPDALPADVFDRVDKLADVAAMLRDVERDIGWCMDDQRRMPGFDSKAGPPLHTLTAARLALDIIIREMNDQMHDELEAAVLRRQVARRRRRPNAVPLDSAAA